MRVLALPPMVMSARLTRPDARAKSSKAFIHLGFISCLILQRFGLMMGSSMLFISLPMFLALLGWMLARGDARVRPTAIKLYGLFVVLALVSTYFALLYPDGRVGFSLTSLLGILVTYSMLVIGPGRKFDGSQTLNIFLFYARLCAALGIAQYLIQFVGIRIFSFMVTVPALKPFLVEAGFAYRPILRYGSDIMRSNGFFLLEPSIFSQILVLAIAIEYFVKEQVKFLPLYGVAYLFSFSGTGLLGLCIAIPIYAVISWRNIKHVAGFALVAAILMVFAAIALPNQFASLAGRANEAQYSGSSGYARYVAQFDAIEAFSADTRSVIGFGPGATDRSTYWVAGSGNAALKLFIDYGLIGLAGFFAFLIGSVWRRDIAIVSILSVALFQFGGGYLLFTPLIVLIALLCIWSTPEAPPQRRYEARRY